tara:strand:+ start:1267 stop:1581 length:315 start_codon:yes stop_codon:yes gene_type:complete
MGMEKRLINHVDGGTVEVLQYVDNLDHKTEDKKLSKNQKRKLLKGYYSKEKHVAMLTSLMNGKYYNRKANNKNGLLPSQWHTVKQSALPIDLQAHIIREQEKRI